MDGTTPTTKSMPPFWPTSRYNLDIPPSLGHYGTFLEEHRGFHDGARKVHETVVALTTGAAAKRHRGRQCRFPYQMDGTTPTTKSMPPFWPTCRYNLDIPPSLGHYGTFLEEQRWFHDGARKKGARNRRGVDDRCSGEAASRSSVSLPLPDGRNDSYDQEYAAVPADVPLQPRRSAISGSQMERLPGRAPVVS
ncbi:hypothetical protein MTO96_013268 [Rhipicephalus appendiculatus]